MKRVIETGTVLYRIDGQAFLDAVTQAPVMSGVLLGGVMRGLGGRAGKVSDLERANK